MVSSFWTPSAAFQAPVLLITSGGMNITLKPLHTEARSVLPTDEAAAHLNRQPQTLRKWAMNGEGPIQPIKVGRRLGWPVAGLRKLVGA